jgi:type I restriction enzyme S subunit
MKEYFLSNRRGIRQKNLNLGMIKNFEIPVADYNLQNKFAEIVTNIEGQKAIVKQSIAESQNLFNSLMSRYFD